MPSGLGQNRQNEKSKNKNNSNNSHGFILIWVICPSPHSQRLCGVMCKSLIYYTCFLGILTITN